MGKERKIANYMVHYNSDPKLVTDNHKSNILHLLDTDARGFDDIMKAISFLSECTNPITTIEDLVPTLKEREKEVIEYLLPVKKIVNDHTLITDIETRIIPEIIYSE